VGATTVLVVEVFSQEAKQTKMVKQRSDFFESAKIEGLIDEH
jgi:hypothetical protein